jgi:hypothetical protein
MKTEIFFTIVERLGTLSEGTKGWAKQLNLVSWNGRDAKYDIREWSPEGDKMSKGVSLSVDELKQLKALLNSIDI